MDNIPPPPPNQPTPQPVVVVQKKRGCLGWIGLGVVALIGLVIVGGVLGALAGSDDGDTPVQAVASSADESVSSTDDGSAEPSDSAAPSGPDGSRDQPWPAGSTVDVTWDVFGDADESVWATTIGPVTDITAQVLAENQFNETPPDGVVYAGFPVTMTLQSANKEPLSAGFNLSFEIHGAANVYDPGLADATAVIDFGGDRIWFGG